MKKSYALLIAALCAALASCFKDEPLNAEADIEQAFVHVDSPENMFFSNSDTLVNVLSTSTSIVFNTKSNRNLTALAPQFRLTEGATIEPESGSVHDFSNGQIVSYTVTSEDGQWKRNYNVKFSPYNLATLFSFDNYSLDESGSYYVWTEPGMDGGQESFWATGNAGYKMSKSSAKAEDYPTTVDLDGYFGSAVKLTTCDTGAFGKMFNKPIAAGNIFIGTFNSTTALTDAMKATQFGRPFSSEPRRFSGWYKYKRGATVTDAKLNVVEGAVDKGDIYAVMYRNKDANGNPVVLYGNDVLTSDAIVAIARVDIVEETDEWTHFDVAFEYKGEIDHAVLANNGYSLSVVATSSIDGADFVGAVGSTLYVDELEIACKGNDND